MCVCVCYLTFYVQVRLVLRELPSIGSGAAVRVPVSYAAMVDRGLATAERTARMLAMDESAPRLFVQDYLKLLGDSDGTSFGRILDMKGLKRSAQQPLMDEFYSQCPSAAAAAAAAAAEGKTSTGRFGKLMKRF